MNSLIYLIISLFLVCSITCQSQTEFTPNQGQWHENVLFRTEIPGGSFFAEEEGFTYYFYDLPKTDASPGHKPSTPEVLKTHAYKVHFEGANPEKVAGKDICKNYKNYFKGNSKEKWAEKVHPVKKVIYEQLYSGVNLTLYSKPKRLKYDFEIEPEGDPSLIQLRYEGVENIFIENGNLIIKTSVNNVTEHRPFSYQIIDGVTTVVDCEYTLNNNFLTFSIGEYDTNHPLIIDPELSFSTFIGSVARNFGTTATGDSQGNLVAGTIVFEADYPTTMGAISSDFDFFMNSVCDVAISKFSPDGTQLLYSTYLGGDALEVAHNIVCDSEDNIIILGNTGSADFPTSDGAFSQTLMGGPQVPLDFVEGIGLLNPNGVDLFITKIATDGSLAASTYFGGSNTDGINQYGKLYYNYGDMFRGEIIVDQNDNVLVASITDSDDFPVTANAAQPGFGGGNCDAVVFKLDPLLGNLMWSTYFGGSGNDNGCSLELTASGDVFLAGGTSSSDLPTASSSVQEVFGGEIDGFITKYNSNGNIAVCTYNGTASYDQNYFVRLNDQEDVFVIGQSEGNIETFGNVYSNASSGQYIQKLSNDLSEILLSTTIGTGSGAVDLSLMAFQVTDFGQVCFSGWGGNHNVENYAMQSTTFGLPLTGDAYQSNTDGNDYYICTLNENMSDLAYASFFGGDVSEEHVDGGSSKIKKDGTLYQAVCAGCEGNSDFPTTARAWGSTNNSESCNLGVFKFDLSTTSTTNIQEHNDYDLIIYPNPTDGRIRLNKPSLVVNIYDQLGQLVQTTSLAGSQEVDLMDLEAGYYILEAWITNGEVFRETIIKH